MNLADELKKLAELHASGALSDDEFQQAKKKMLFTPVDVSDEQHSANRADSLQAYPFRSEADDSVGRAANRYMTFQVVMTVLGILFVLILFGPTMCKR